MSASPWIVCQLGAREHYAVARALQQCGALECLVTDLWVPPAHPWANLPVLGDLPAARRMRGRHHQDLADARVLAPNVRTMVFEALHRLRRQTGSADLLTRYAAFQKSALRLLEREYPVASGPRTLFSYSNTALELFRFAKQRGWQTVLGQVDPGPEEQRIVAAEHRRYPALATHWQPAPPSYWEGWHQEIALADRIIVNSTWSRDCLLKEGVSAEKLEIVPLVYTSEPRKRPGRAADGPLQVLFLGQISLRKGVGRLLDAMRLLKDEPIALTLAGPTTIDPSAWADLPNVRWTGPVPRSDVGRLYDAADVFILPTLSDGFALTQLEALARGLPVIASKQCGNAVIDGQNGWIFQDLQPETIANTLRALDVTALKEPVRIAGKFGMGKLGSALLNPSNSSPRNSNLRCEG
jgi:glycosyltransferase involved in cell wall biosynthesis